MLVFWIQALYASTFEIVDKLGRKVEVNIPVRRAIIAITYEFIPALNIWDQVIGVSEWAERICSVYRAYVFTNPKLRKPLVGSGSNPNIEAILSLHPDLVITWSFYPKTIKFLEEKGIKVIAIYPENLSELYEVIRLYGKLFRKEKRAEIIIQEMEKIFNLIKDRVSNIPASQRKKVIHLSGKPTTVSCKIGVTNDIINIIGAINPAGFINQKYVDISVEKIIEWNPDVIFIWGAAGYDESWLYNNSQWQYIKAVKNHKVYKLPRWSTWSPRLALIALYMAIKTYPEYFKDIDFEKIANEFYLKVFGISYKEAKKYEIY